MITLPSQTHANSTELPETEPNPPHWKRFELQHLRLTEAGEVMETVTGYQVGLILSGPVSVCWRSGGRSVSRNIGPQDLCRTSHGDFRSLSWNAPFDFLRLTISPQVMADLSEERGDGKAVELIADPAFRDPTILNLMQMLHPNVASVNGSSTGPLFGEQLCLALAVYLFEHYCAFRPKEKSVTTRLPGMVLKKILVYIEERISEPITIEHLANHVQMSRFYFSRLFRNTVGQSPGQFVLDRRMDRAKALLAKGSCDLKEVARLSGFSSESHFASAFRLRNGITPSRYRGMQR